MVELNIWYNGLDHLESVQCIYEKKTTVRLGREQEGQKSWHWPKLCKDEDVEAASGPDPQEAECNRPRTDLEVGGDVSVNQGLKEQQRVRVKGHHYCLAANFLITTCLYIFVRFVLSGRTDTILSNLCKDLVAIDFLSDMDVFYSNLWWRLPQEKISDWL